MINVRRGLFRFWLTSSLLALALLAFVALVAGLVQAQQTQPPKTPPNVHGWMIESWKDGTITVQHEGYTYLATCDVSSYMKLKGNTWSTFPKCTLALDFIGRNIQPPYGLKGTPQREPDGWIVVMLEAGDGSLILSRSKDEQTEWFREQYSITSVQPVQPCR